MDKHIFIIQHRRQTVIYTFNSNEAYDEDILRPIYEKFNDAVDRHGYAFLHSVDALTEFIASKMPEFNKVNELPDPAPISCRYFILICENNRIYTYKSITHQPTAPWDYWDGKLTMITKFMA